MPANAQNRATVKYKRERYDRINLLVKKGQGDRIKAAAEKRGQSVNGFICTAVFDAVREALGERDEKLSPMERVYRLSGSI